MDGVAPGNGRLSDVKVIGACCRIANQIGENRNRWCRNCHSGLVDVRTLIEIVRFRGFPNDILRVDVHS